MFLVFVWRYGLRRTLKGLRDRFGLCKKRPNRGKGLIWVHAASVGEVRAVEPFLRALPKKLAGYERGLTTTSVSGKELAEKMGVAEHVNLAPLDLCFCVRWFVRRMRPDVLVLVETELWPNWIRTLHHSHVPVCLVNGRISDQAYGSYAFLRFLWTSFFSCFSLIGVQSPGYASRFRALGADERLLRVTGNLKYDVPLPDLSRKQDLLKMYGFDSSDTVWVCGSTRDGEEDIISDVFLSLCQKGLPLKVVLAPRHIDRVPEISQILNQKGISFRLRSQIGFPQAHEPEMSFNQKSKIKNQKSIISVLLLDTVGELAEVYGAGSFAFVGGSLKDYGGQNPLEPARWKIPVIFGPYMQNFKEMAQLFLDKQGAVQVTDGRALEEAVFLLAQNPDQCASLGESAKTVAASQQGALESSLKLLEEVMENKT